MKLNSLNRFSEIVIQIHNDPDADAIGSGYAVYRYFKSLGKDVRLVYGGRNAISKSNIKLMVSELEISVEYVREIAPPELLLTVDCQYGEGNVERFEARNIAMIDHHNTGRCSDEMCEIRSNLVSCATICYSMLNDEGFDMNADVKIATALFYGLFMDSSQLSEISHPLDRDMIDLLQYDKTLVTRLRYANYSLAELETTGYAISHHNYMARHRLSVVKSKPCDPNILGVISDFVIQVDSVDLCVVYNKLTDGYKLSVRSCSPECAASEFAAFLTDGTGNGGGHLDKAGGFISEARYSEKFGDKDIEEYLTERADLYFGSFDIVRYTDEISKPEILKRYRKKPVLCGCVKSADLFDEGTEIRVRTLEGDVFVTCRSDVYLMIGTRGEVYPVEKNTFERRYKVTDDEFICNSEYQPSVLRFLDNERKELSEYACCCIAAAGATILARPLEKFTKVFTSWNYETYMSGKAGDMLCYSSGNSRDVYIVRRDVFEEIYEEY